MNVRIWGIETDTMASPVKKAGKPTALATSISPTEDRDAVPMNTDEIASPVLFDRIKNELKDHHKDKNLVLSIPIWGWTGDGKTVAMVTVVHFMEFIAHGVGLTLVSNTAQLHQMESESEVYRGLNLVATAEATTQRFTALAEGFIDKAEWPPGTDEATPYLFEVRTIKGPAAYLLMPDIRGGSYRESDAQAREVLRSAHAAIILINPKAFVAKSFEGKRYRDAVTGRIQEVLAEGIPAAILITQSDLYPDSGSPADEAHAQLTVLLSDTDPTQRCIARVSVIGAIADPEGQQRDSGSDAPPMLPPADLRKPDQLVRAFAWLLWKTLVRPKADLHRVIPQVSLQPSLGTPTAVASVLLPEMRRVGEYSGSPGTLLAAWASDPKSTSFIFLTNKGDLIAASLGTEATEPRLAKCGRLEGATEVADVTAFLSSGILTIGARDNADFLWHGTKGGDLKKTSLPMTLTRWTSIEQNLIVGIDASGTGRLSTFRLDNDTWTQVSHVGEFIPHTALLALAFLKSRGFIIALNGDRAEAIQIKSDGSFGERVAPPLQLKYDTPSVACNSAGIACATLASGQFIISLNEKPVAVGAALDTDRARFALASQSPVVAVVQPDSRLIVARVGLLGIKQTQASYSPVLSAPPLSMQWSPNGSLLAVTFEAGTWAAFRPFGLGQG